MGMGVGLGGGDVIASCCWIVCDGYLFELLLVNCFFNLFFKNR